MRIRRLQIESWQLARLSVVTQRAGLSISAPIRRIKTIQQQQAKMNVNRQDPSLEVNMESLRNNIGLKSAVRLARDAAAEALAQTKQNIKNIENNGDYIAALPQRGNPIAAIARSSLTSVKQVPQASGVIDPTVSVKSNPGSLSIDWSLQDITISWDDYQAPVITVEPKPRVDVQLVQEPNLEFKIVESSYPPETGRTIDAAI